MARKLGSKNRRRAMGKIPSAREMGLADEGYAKTSQALFGYTRGRSVTAAQRREIDEDWRARLADAKRLTRS